jgi:hypothetical protein
MKVIKKGQYASSAETFEGTRKEVLNYLRNEALTIREQSRATMPKEFRNVHAILGEHKHPAEIVNLASFKIKQMGIKQLLPLMNAHGVFNYSIEESEETFSPEKLINWGELSRLLSGNRSSITRKRIPAIRQEKINQLFELLENWYNDAAKPSKIDQTGKK